MFKFFSIILIIYALIGIAITVFIEPNNNSIIGLIVYITLFILVPCYGAYAAWYQKRIGLIICTLLFIAQSIRSIGDESWLPYFPPISLGFPVGDFANGQGYLIDLFAIFMVALLAWLFRKLIYSHK